MNKWIQLFLLLFLWDLCFAQIKPILTFGSLDTNVVSVEEFNSQKNLKVQDGYAIDSAVVCFGGAHFPSIRVINFMPELDSVNLFACKELLVPGSWVAITCFVRKKFNNELSKAFLSFVFYSMTKRNIAPPSPSFNEWKRLRNLEYISGTIYFSGQNSGNVVSFFIKGKDLPELKKCFDRCVAGTTITFENVTYKDEQNNIDKLNIRFKIK